MSKQATITDVLAMLQEVEEMSFYVMTQEPDRFKKGRRKVVNEKIRDAVMEAVAVIQKEQGGAHEEV